MRPIIAAALLLVATACVPKKDYLALESELATTRQDLQAQLADRNAAITRLEGENAALEGRVRKLSSELEAKESALVALREKNANMLAAQGDLTAEVEQMKAALAELEERKAQADARLAEFRSLVSRFQKLIDAGTLEVKIVDGRMVVAMATDVLFASGSATLSQAGKDAIAEVAGILAGIPDRAFQIEGHTDNVPISSERFPSNWHLASARAINVVDHMVASGMAPDKVSAASYGEFKPVDTNRTKDGRTRNRRIEIVVVPDLSELPGYDELADIQAPAADGTASE